MSKILMYAEISHSNGTIDSLCFAGKYEKRPNDMPKSEYLHSLQMAFLDEITSAKSKGYVVIGAPYDVTGSSVAINTENIDTIWAQAVYAKDDKKFRKKATKEQGRKKGKKKAKKVDLKPKGKKGKKSKKGKKR